jgi:hypothetical protein
MKKIKFTCLGRKITSVTMFLLLGATAATSQGLFSVISADPSGLSAGQQARLGKVLQQPTVESVHFLQVAHLPSIQQNGVFEAYIPGRGCTAMFKALRVDLKESGDYYLYGEIFPSQGGIEVREDGECPSGGEGYVSLISIGGELSGSLMVDDERYELYDLGEGKSILAKKNFPDIEEACYAGEAPPQVEAPGIEERSWRDCPVRVLALYTPGADTLMPNINNTIHLGIQQANQALINSGVHEGQLKLVLATSQPELVQFSETGIAESDVDSLNINPFVQQRRAETNADIVIVYTDNSYPDFFGRVAGIGPDPAKATAIAEADAVSIFTDAHEIAHLFGCRHHNDTAGTFEHAHDFTTGSGRRCRLRTTTVFAGFQNTRIPYFSNPQVQFQGVPTGVAETRFNARQLREQGCTVANFVDDDVIPTLVAKIIGPYYGCPCSGHTISGAASGGAPGAYSYEWRYGPDPFSLGPVQCTTPQCTVPMPCAEGDGLYVRLKVTSVDGQASVANQIFISAQDWEERPFPCPTPFTVPSDPQSLAARPAQGVAVIYPNPSAGQVSFSADGIERVRVFDQYGKLAARLVIEAPLKGETMMVDLSDRAPGVYFFEFSAGGQMFTERVLVFR